MSRGRTMTVAAALLVAVTGLLVTAGPAAGTVAPPPRPLVIVAVPGLSWADVARMPGLAARLPDASYAELTDKTVTSATRCVDGMTAFSAGVRTGYGPLRCSIDGHTLKRLRHKNATGSYAADIGTFGSALRTAGYATVAVGSDAKPLLADDAGQVDRVAPTLATATSSTGGSPVAIAVLVDELYRADPPSEPEVQAAERRILETLDAAPADALVAVVGVSDNATGRSHLRALMLFGSDAGHATLTTVGRSPVMQLIDVGPVLLDQLGVPPSRDVSVSASGSTPSIPSMVDDDRRAVGAANVGGPSRLVIWLGVTGLALLLFAGRLRIGRPLALLLCFVPVSAYVAMLVPWWRHGAGGFAVVVAVLATAAATLTWLVTRRSTDPRLPVLVVTAAVFLVLLVDQLAGAPLQFSAPLGDNPLVAGRFHGMGNTDFAVFEAAAVVAAGVLAVELRRRGRAAAALAVVATVALVAIVVDAAPMLGDDFGGTLALLPTWICLAWAISGVRVSAGRVLAAGISAAVVVVGIALLDYARPAADQTHIGRFVGSVLHGGAGDVLHRKLTAATGSLSDTPALLVCIVGLIAVVLVLRQRDVLPIVTPGVLLAIGLLAVLGSGLNDSGIAVGAFVVSTALPALALGARLPSAQPVGPVGHADPSELNTQPVE